MPRRPQAAGPAPADLARLPGRVRVESLDNGLTVALLSNPQAPTVTSALWYRAGTRDEPEGHGGVAHFLEHMMFKGTQRLGPGEIDRRTQALGGSNNAFTSHDATVYYFNFARDRWRWALEIEAERMRGLALAPDQVDSERQVILEEISMYESDPWDALNQRVEARLFRRHPYGKPVLGTPPELAATGPEALADFHRRFYRPDNAVLVLAGDLDDGAFEAAAEAFGDVPAGADARPERPPALLPEELVRFERRAGDVPRLLVAFPSPAGGEEEDLARVRLLPSLLGDGRGSRLERGLVDERELASAVSVSVSPTLDRGALAIFAELVPGVEPDDAESALFDELERLRAEAPSDAEVERARRVHLADWVFDHERIHQQALAAGSGLALFDLEHTERQRRRVLEVSAGELHETARRWLDPGRGAVLGSSLPHSREAREDVEEKAA